MLRRFASRLVIAYCLLVALNSTVVAQSPTIYNVFNMPAGLHQPQVQQRGRSGQRCRHGRDETSSEDILNINGSPDHSTGYGSVQYNYAMGTYDVTAAQYVQFLNAVAKTGDPYGLYNPSHGRRYVGPLLVRSQ